MAKTEGMETTFREISAKLEKYILQFQEAYQIDGEPEKEILSLSKVLTRGNVVWQFSMASQNWAHLSNVHVDAGVCVLTY